MNDERIMLGELATLALAERGAESLLLLLREYWLLDEAVGAGVGSKASSDEIMPAMTAWFAGLLFTRLGETFLLEAEVSRVLDRRSCSGSAWW